MSNRRKKNRDKRLKYEERHSKHIEKTHSKLKGGFNLWQTRKRG